MGQGFEFDGSGDYINVGDQSELHPTTEVSYSAWVYPSSNPISSNNTIMGYRAFSELHFILNNSNGMRCALYGGDANDVDGVINPLQWNHVVCTFNDSTNTIKMYVNNVLVDENTNYTNSISVGSNDFYIGSLAGHSLMNGKIDDVRIYNRALTTDEIELLYNLGR